MNQSQEEPLLRHRQRTLVLAILSELSDAPLRAVCDALDRHVCPAVRKAIFDEILRRADFPFSAAPGLRNYLFARTAPVPAVAQEYLEVCSDMLGNRIDSPDPDIRRIGDTILALLEEHGFQRHEMWPVVQDFYKYIDDLGAKFTVQDALGKTAQGERTVSLRKSRGSSLPAPTGLGTSPEATSTKSCPPKSCHTRTNLLARLRPVTNGNGKPHGAGARAHGPKTAGQGESSCGPRRLARSIPLRRAAKTIPGHGAVRGGGCSAPPSAARCRLRSGAAFAAGTPNARRNTAKLRKFSAVADRKKGGGKP